MENLRSNNMLATLLNYSNDNIVSNWSRLASLIKLYEQIEWVDARKKAGTLIRAGEAANYVQNIRSEYGELEMVESPPVHLRDNSESASIRKKKKASGKRRRMEENYKRLLSIAPDIEDRILNAGNSLWAEVQGDSKVTGYSKIELFLFEHQNDDYYLTLMGVSHVNEKRLEYPNMQFILNPVKQTLEAIGFEEGDTFTSVYDDPFEKKLINLKEFKVQNAFLEEWLKQLQKQKHRIEWKSLVNQNAPAAPDDEGWEDEEETATLTMPLSVADDDYAPAGCTPEKFKFLTNVVMEAEHCIKGVAERKVHDLVRENKTEAYLNDLIKKEEQKVRRHYKERAENLFRQFEELLHKFAVRVENGTIFTKLVSESHHRFHGYKIDHSPILSPGLYQISISETGKRQGVLSVAVNLKERKVWVSSCKGRFLSSRTDYEWPMSWDKTPFNTVPDDLLERWMNFVQTAGYYPTNYFADPLLKPIPDFEVGKVELTDSHRHFGIKQEDIDWINENEQGLVFVPRRYPSGEEPEGYVKRRGFRISGIGKMFFYGRSHWGRQKAIDSLNHGFASH